MGKAGRKRNKARRRWLVGLAETNPHKFMFEWKKRVESWIAIVYIGANRDKAEEIANMIFKDLYSLGQDAARIALDYTVRRLSEVVAHVSNTPKTLYNLGNYWEKIEDSHRRGARAPYGTNR